jgi:phosphoglycerate dehydrogenase-like enzyme
MPNTVLLTDRPFGSDEIEQRALAAAGLELHRAPNTDPATLARLAEQASGILACYAQVDRTVIEAAARGRCRVIARYGIGYDNIAVESASRAGIVVTYVPDYCIGEVADHTIALLLAVGRAIVRAASAVRAGAWEVPNTGVRRLQRSRLAVIGVGRIGHEVAVRALSFGMKVIAYDPYVDEWDRRLQRAESLEEALSGAHFVSLHTPLTADIHHLIGTAEIDLLSDGAVLVNTSRGGLVDLAAVTVALDNGKLSGVGLDVTDPEPLPATHPLRAHPLAVITAHMSFYSAEAQDELQRRAVASVVDVLQGRLPSHPVNPEVFGGAR